MTEIYPGTSGFSYKEWKGAFYPEKIKPEEMLAFYGSKLPSVEINNTFYRMPKKAVLEQWAQQVPEDFRFVIKASRRITHFKRLHDTDEEISYLLSQLAALGERLGCVLFQLPPNLKADTERLKTFLASLPGGVSVAFEFRHASWFEDVVLDALRDAGAALCQADTDDAKKAPELIATASWGYLRLRREKYSPAALKKWMKAIQDQDWSHAFVFFKHEDDAAGPKMAERFRKLGA
jgi:uncharacterized protein YecE (DUF72 family)